MNRAPQPELIAAMDILADKNNCLKQKHLNYTVHSILSLFVNQIVCKPHNKKSRMGGTYI
jgi:hypothetical protein